VELGSGDGSTWLGETEAGGSAGCEGPDEADGGAEEPPAEGFPEPPGPWVGPGTDSWALADGDPDPAPALPVPETDGVPPAAAFRPPGQGAPPPGPPPLVPPASPAPAVVPPLDFGSSPPCPATLIQPVTASTGNSRAAAVRMRTLTGHLSSFSGLRGRFALPNGPPGRQDTESEAQVPSRIMGSPESQVIGDGPPPPPVPARRPAVLRGQAPVLAVIALGGATGACARYGAVLLWPTAPGAFPWTTLAVNALGCAVIGAFMVVITELLSPHRLVRPFFGTGVLGGFTTFSTYAVDIQRLADAGHAALALAYLAATLLAAMLSVWAAAALTRRLLT